MTRNRLALAAATALAAAATFGATSAQAAPDTVEPVRVNTSDYLACAGVDGVAATCVKRPDITTLPKPRQVIYDLTGVPI